MTLESESDHICQEPNGCIDISSTNPEVITLVTRFGGGALRPNGIDACAIGNLPDIGQSIHEKAPDEQHLTSRT